MCCWPYNSGLRNGLAFVEIVIWIMVVFRGCCYRCCEQNFHSLLWLYNSRRRFYSLHRNIKITTRSCGLSNIYNVQLTGDLCVSEVSDGGNAPSAILLANIWFWVASKRTLADVTYTVNIAIIRVFKLWKLGLIYHQQL